MAEQAYVRSPHYFSQFSKNCKLYITESYPEVDSSHTIVNFAYAFHRPGGACKIKNPKHWHILIYSPPPATDQLQKTVPITKQRCRNSNPQYLIDDVDNSKPIDVPCPYSAFRLLILDGVNNNFGGEFFEKMAEAVSCNECYENDFANQEMVLTRNLPRAVKLENVSVQTNRVSTETIERITRAMNGPNGAAFALVLDAILSACGEIHFENQLYKIDFNLEKL